jgi:hypothetical protein
LPGLEIRGGSNEYAFVFFRREGEGTQELRDEQEERRGPAPMKAIFLEARTHCPACDGLVPVNALVPKIGCSHCGRVLELTPEQWDSNLGLAFMRLSELKLGERRTMREGTGRSAFYPGYDYGWCEPSFPGSKQRIDLVAAKAAIPTGHIVDPSTGRPWPVRAIPADYAKLLAGVKCLLCEDANLLATAAREAPLAAGGPKSARAFRCPHCGAALGADGTQRSIPCAYCGTIAFIPDDVWCMLHAVELPTPWYLLCVDSGPTHRWGS